MAQTQKTRSHGRGRQAERPSRIPAAGWKDVLKRVKTEAKRDHVPLLAAGVAFYGMLAIPPALVALVSLYGLVGDPGDIERQLGDALRTAPPAARSLLVEQMGTIAGASQGALTLGLIVGVLVALWSASAGMKHLMTAVSVAYDEEETRGFVRLRAIALLLTLGAVVFVVVMAASIALVPALLEGSGVGAAVAWAIRIVRWPLMLLALMAGLAVLYRYAPDRDQPQWQWVSWGAAIAGVLWLAGSLLFSFYSANFGSYNETYGSLAGVVVLLLWLLLTAAVVLIGAEINAELEHQTAQDTTEGHPRPMGERDAYVADHVAGGDTR